MRDNPTENDLLARLERLEVLYSEQDYTIQALNDSVSQQDRELKALTLSLQRLQVQLDSLRSEVGGVDPVHEPPPHY